LVEQRVGKSERLKVRRPDDDRRACFLSTSIIASGAKLLCHFGQQNISRAHSKLEREVQVQSLDKFSDGGRTIWKYPGIPKQRLARPALTGWPASMAAMNKRRGFAVETVAWVVAIGFGYYSRHTRDWGAIAFFLVVAAVTTTVFRRAMN